MVVTVTVTALLTVYLYCILSTCSGYCDWVDYVHDPQVLEPHLRQQRGCGVTPNRGRPEIYRDEHSTSVDFYSIIYSLVSRYTLKSRDPGWAAIR